MESSSAYSEVPLLDRLILDQYTMANPALQRELFTIFLGQVPEYLSALKVALDADSSEDWHMTAHGVKGAARSLGFSRLALLAENAERAGPTEQGLSEIAAVFEALAEVLPVSDAA